MTGFYMNCNTGLKLVRLVTPFVKALHSGLNPLGALPGLRNPISFKIPGDSQFQNLSD